MIFIQLNLHLDSTTINNTLDPRSN